MRRRDFISSALAACAAVSRAADPEVVVERNAAGKPHAGKVLAAIQPHADDLPIFAGGTVAKLLAEGYTGYMIRTTNDDMAGRGTNAETALANEQDVHELVRVMGLKRDFSLNYSNHEMDGISKPELRSRLIFLFRLLKVDTIVCYDPWGTYEENPDHYVTAQCVEAACWMAGDGQGLSGAVRRRPAAARRPREVLLRARAAAGEPGGRHHVAMWRRRSTRTW